MEKMATNALFLIFCLCLCGVEAQNTSSCYFCQETDEVCKDPVNVAILPAVRCAEMNFVSARSRQVEEHGLSAQINDIIVNDIEPRSRSGIERNYQCLKVAVTINSTDNSTTITDGVLRTCVPVADDVASYCDFLSEEITSNYTINFCEVCDGDKCNGSAHLSASALLGMVLLTLAGCFLK